MLLYIAFLSDLAHRYVKLLIDFYGLFAMRSSYLKCVIQCAVQPTVLFKYLGALQKECITEMHAFIETACIQIC